MAINLQQIAEAVHGQVDGARSFEVSRLSSLESAAGDSLAFFADINLTEQLRATAAGAVMLRAEHASLFAGHKLIVADPYLAYARASALFAPPTVTGGGVHPSAIIAESATVSARATVGAFVTVGHNTVIADGAVIGNNVSIGDDCTVGDETVISAGVHLGAHTVIGARCRIASGTVIGAAGFGYVPEKNEWRRIEQLGGVVIGDDVDIGANTAIDRGALDDTVIGNGVKLDNHIQIAHNVRVGEHTVMAGCVAIAGSTVIGARCQLGGRAAVLGHLEIADDVRINTDSFVARSITEAGAYSSMLPAQPAARWRKTLAHINRLTALAEKVKSLRG